MRPSGNIQGGFNFMIIRSIKNITRQYWDIILMSDIVIDRVNLLVKYQQDILVFTCFNGRIIGDGDVEITGVDRDWDGDENEAPLKIENENYLDYQ